MGDLILFPGTDERARYVAEGRTAVVAQIDAERAAMLRAASAPSAPSADPCEGRTIWNTAPGDDRPRLICPPPLIHVRTWTGSGTGRVTEMRNAGKAGKTCRALRVLGTSYTGPGYAGAQQATCSLMALLEAADPAESFDSIAARLRAIVAGLTGSEAIAVTIEEETIKGIDAPRALLTAGVPGEWSAKADEDGICLRDLRDVNEWTEITHRQTKAAAYTIAARAWPAVLTATTRGQASDILRTAGARLHGYCAMD